MCNIEYRNGLRSLSTIYTTGAIKNIINHDGLLIFKSKINKHRKNVLSKYKSSKVSDLLKNVYQEMTNNYRNEYIYKNKILYEYLLKRYSLRTTILLNEFKIGKSIADTILINGEVKLFEIKTDLDNLLRLESQLIEYSKAVEKIYIVTNTRFIKKLKEIYSHESYGLIEFTDNNRLKIHKDAAVVRDNFEHTILFKMLRKQEYIKLIKDNFGYVPDVPNTLIYRECLKKSFEIDIISFQKMVFNLIKKRNIRSPELLKNNKTPDQLKYICYTLDLDNNEYDRLYNILDTVI